MTRDEMVRAYVARQDTTVEHLNAKLDDLIQRYDPDGFILLECQMFNSSRMGDLTILPFGPRNTFKVPPSHPVSPRGLASDMSTVVGVVHLRPGSES